MYRHDPYIDHNGVRNNLRHLFPKDHQFEFKCGTMIDSTIWFSNHCYTEELTPEDSREGKIILLDHNRNERYFCPKRYSYTLMIDSWLQGWSSQSCYFSRDKRGAENWLIVEDHAEMKVKVSFSANQHRNKHMGLALWVKTIHPYDISKPPSPSQPTVPFHALAKGVALSGKAPKPRDRRRKRR